MGMLVGVGDWGSVAVAVAVATDVAVHGDLEVAVGVAAVCPPGVAEIGPCRSEWPLGSMRSSQ